MLFCCCCRWCCCCCCYRSPSPRPPPCIVPDFFVSFESTGSQAGGSRKREKTVIRYSGPKHSSDLRRNFQMSFYPAFQSRCSKIEMDAMFSTVMIYQDDFQTSKVLGLVSRRRSNNDREPETETGHAGKYCSWGRTTESSVHGAGAHRE